MLRAPICRLNQRMASTSLLVLFLLAVFTTDVHSEKVLNVLKGSTAVLTPGHVERSIIAVSWKHGGDLAAEWFGGSPTFYRSFKDRCSLNTKTGELTINEVRLEHSGVYTPEINNRILTDIRLQVLSPVPKPSILFYCNSEQTQCTLTCVFDRTDDLGDVQVFWILDDIRVKGGSRLSITKEMKETTFICRLKNPVSSENSNELKNPLLPNEALIISLAVLIPCIILISLGFLVYHRRKVRKEIERLRKKKKQYKDERQRLQKELESSQKVRQTPLNAAGGDAAPPEETPTQEPIPVTAEINHQNESNPQEPDLEPATTPSIGTTHEPNTKTDEDPENLNKDPSEEVTHETGSGSAENDPPETERAEASSGSPDGGVSTSEPSLELLPLTAESYKRE